MNVAPKTIASDAFQELGFSPRQAADMAGDIKRSSVAFLDKTEQTNRFLEKQSSSAEGWKEGKGFWKEKNLIDSDFAGKATMGVAKVLSELTGIPESEVHDNLIPIDFKIMHVPDGDCGTTRWHKDNDPKVMALLTNIKGKPTEYIEKRHADRFEKKIGIEMKPREGVDPQPIVQRADPGTWMMFRAGLFDGALIHRAPVEDDRIFFLARWKANADFRKKLHKQLENS